jgi:hypothetical protein
MHLPFLFQGDAVVDKRLMEAHESYMRTVPLWHTGDLSEERNHGAAADTAAVEADTARTHPETFGLMHTSSSPRADDNIFSGEAGHKLFIRLLMQGDSGEDSEPSGDDDEDEDDDFGNCFDMDMDFDGAGGDMQDSRLVPGIGELCGEGLDFAALRMLEGSLVR